MTMEQLMPIVHSVTFHTELADRRWVNQWGTVQSLS